jgi:hypothetical protein
MVTGLAATAMVAVALAYPGSQFTGAPTSTSTNAKVLDSFNRDVAHGLGSATHGGAWLLSGDRAHFSVASGSGHLSLTSPGNGVAARLEGVSTTNQDLRATVGLTKAPTGGGTYVTVQGRAMANSDYRATLRFRSDGKVALYLARRVAGHDATIKGMYVPGLRSRAGAAVRVRLSVNGTNPSRLAVKAWPATSQEPRHWQLSSTDRTAALQRPGTVGLVTYLSSSASPGQAVSIDDLRSVSTMPSSRPSARPTAAPVPSRSQTATPTRTATRTSHSAPSSTTSRPATASKPTTGTTKPTRTSRPTTSSTTTKPSKPAGTPAGGMPGPGTTGVPPTTKLKVHNGDLNITKAGTVVDGLDIRGFLTINAANVTVRNSIIRGRSTSRMTNLVTSKSPGFVIEDSELAPQNPSPFIDGLKGYGFTARRLDIHGTVDGVFIYGSNTTVESSWIHGNRHYQNDPNQGGTPSHDDSIQVQGGTNIRLIDNRIEGAFNAGLMVTQDAGRLSNVQFVGNWADGGGCTVNVAEKGRGPIKGLVVSDNRFGHHTRVPDCPVIAPSTTPMVAQGNVYADSGAPARIRRNG